MYSTEASRKTRSAHDYLLIPPRHYDKAAQRERERDTRIRSLRISRSFSAVYNIVHVVVVVVAYI